MPDSEFRRYTLEGQLPVRHWGALTEYLGAIGLTVAPADEATLQASPESPYTNVPLINHSNLEAFERTHPDRYSMGTGTRMWNALCNAAKAGRLPDLHFEGGDSTTLYLDLSFSSLDQALKHADKVTSSRAGRSGRYQSTFGFNIGEKSVGFLRDFVKYTKEQHDAQTDTSQ